MVYPLISNPKTTTITTFAGDALNKIHRYFSDVDLGSIDATDIPVINTNTVYKANRLRIRNAAATPKEVYFTVPDTLATDAELTVPDTLDNVSPNEILFTETVQTIEGKIIDATLNTISNLDNDNIVAGAGIETTKLNLGGGTTNFLRADGIWAEPPGAGGGEANTTANTGTGGTSIIPTVDKSGVVLNFKSMYAASTKVSISDGGANNRVEYDITESNIKLDDLGATDDNIDLNSSITKHGLFPKLSTTAFDVFRINSGGTAGEWASLDSERTGKATDTGDGSTTQFTIAHGLGSIPSYAFVDCSSHAIARTWAVDGTNITVDFVSAIPNAESLVIYWRVIA